MTLDADKIDRPVEDPVSNILKWTLLAVALVCFALMIWASVLTYRAAPPHPNMFVDQNGGGRDGREHRAEEQLPHQILYSQFVAGLA